MKYIGTCVEPCHTNALMENNGEDLIDGAAGANTSTAIHQGIHMMPGIAWIGLGQQSTKLISESAAIPPE
jgi:hypothetical protein